MIFNELLSYASGVTKKTFRSRGFGFTLVELIVVITILAILATIGFLALSGYTSDAKDSSVKANVRSVMVAISSESAITNNSPRFYVVHDTGAALSGAVAYVDGSPIVLTGGNWNVSGTNYSAGNPDWAKLKLNPEKFRLSSVVPPSFLSAVFAAYDPGAISVGAFEASLAPTGFRKASSVSFFQVAGVSPVTKMANVSGNYAATWTGSPLGLVKDPSSSSSTWAIVDGSVSSTTLSATSGVCGSASWTIAVSAPTTNLCSAGNASSVSGSGPWSWTCSWANGWTSASCSTFDNFPSSSLLTPDHKATLVGWHGVSTKVWTLCFRATTHGFSSSTFHTNCNNKWPTISVYKFGSNIVGWYGSTSWASVSNYVNNSTSWLFNLNSGTRTVVNVYSQYAQYDNTNYWPTFWGGHDLYCWTSLNGCYANQHSYSPNPVVWYVPYNTTATDLEVWY